MDEIGRGTSTFDGLSLAWEIAKRLANTNKCLTLFATHYFEITVLGTELDCVFNVHLSATEHLGKLVFLHRIEAGPASQSYGLQVAKLAGLPALVVKNAQKRLDQLEAEKRALTAQVDLFEQQAQAQPESEAKAQHVKLILEKLDEIDPDELSPREALQLIFQLKGLQA
jgi:DNA mismatch repair protein MutS